jgi:enterobacterial common antigen flippase
MSTAQAAPVPECGLALAGTDSNASHSQRARSYRSILKSSALIGGASMISVGIGMARTKALAMLLGPSGYGVMGALMMVADLAKVVAQVGINGSGVRQIAESVGSEDASRIALTVVVLRRVSLVCGVIGALALALFSGPVAKFTFGTEGYASSVAVLSLAVVLSVVASGQGALLQGMRRIGDMAKLAVWGSLLGTLVGIPMVYVLGTAGLAPTLVAIAGSSALASWWYSRKIKTEATAVSARMLTYEAASLLKLGMAFMASGLLTLGAAYAVRIIVLRKAGIEAAGIYYAAWTLGGLYIGFVLQALGADFYPRLVAAAKNNAECNRLVNEQAEVSLLMAAPGVLLTLTLSPLAISLFYSAEFVGAIEVLRWICLGMALRVLTWPIGYIVVAKNRQVLFFGIELVWSVVNVTLTWFCVDAYGAVGAGMAFFASYVAHFVVVYPSVRRMTGFRWSAANVRTATVCFGAMLAVFLGFHALPSPGGLALGLTVTALSCFMSTRALVRRASSDRLPAAVSRLLFLRGPSQ